MKTCPNCSANLEDEAAFCVNCGAPVGKMTEQQLYQPPGQAVYQQPSMATAVMAQGPGQQKKHLTKVLIIVGAALIVIAAAIIGIFVLKPSTKTNVLYVKADQLSMTGTNKIAPFELTDSLYDSDGNDVYLRSYIVTSDDGKYMFYPENVSDADSTIDLYFLNLTANNAKKSSAVEIDTGVSSYQTSLDGTKVFYLKSEKLNFFDLKEKVEIASDVSEFYISDDGMKLLYLDMEGTLYSKDMKTGSDAEKIDSDVTIQHISGDLSKAYYIKSEDLYLKEAGKEKVKIASDVSEVPAVYDSGALYYTKSETEDVSLFDYVTDDLASSDAVMTEPEYDDFITTDAEGYPDFDYDAYVDAYDEYYEKQERDTLREELQSDTYSIIRASLYFYDGKESVEVTDSYNLYFSTCPEKTMIAYSKFQSSDVAKMNLSDVLSSNEVWGMLDSAYGYGASFDAFIAIGAKESQVDQEEANQFAFNDTGTMVYFIDNFSYDDYAGDLYYIAITGDTVGKAELYEEAVYDYFYFINNDTSLVYFKDLDNESYCGDMYIDKRKIDTDVFCYDVTMIGDTVNFFYMTGLDPEDYIGTLKQYDGNNTAKIVDDVYNYAADEKGTLAYITNYDTDDEIGDAYLYDGGKEPKLIDKDVAYLLMIG